jgi:hypothetical protein
MPPIGGRKTLRSGRVTSSGYMPPVCSNNVCRSFSSLTPKRAATPGKCHTGSIAAFVTATSPLSCTMSPSTFSRPKRIASRNSGSESRAFVTAMVGRISTPESISASNASVTRCPHGSSDTIFAGSPHCGNGPNGTTGDVSVRSGRAPAAMAPDETASARYTEYEPPCAPITLRSAETEPITGPRSRAVGAPH